jgi:hypothetical protein
MHDTRAHHAATRLADGRVLVVGGFGSLGYGRPLSSAEIYDPASDTWYDAGTLSRERYGHGLTALGDGRAVVTGAAYATGTTESDSIEVFERRKAGETCRDDGECLNLQCIAGSCLRAVLDAGDSNDSDARPDDAGTEAGLLPGDLLISGRACGCRSVGHQGSDGARMALGIAIACLVVRRSRNTPTLRHVFAAPLRGSSPVHRQNLLRAARPTPPPEWATRPIAPGPSRPRRRPLPLAASAALRC